MPRSRDNRPAYEACWKINRLLYRQLECSSEKCVWYPKCSGINPDMNLNKPNEPCPVTIQFDQGEEYGTKYVDCPSCNKRFYGNQNNAGWRSLAEHILGCHPHNEKLFEFAKWEIKRNVSRKHVK